MILDEKEPSESLSWLKKIPSQNTRISRHELAYTGLHAWINTHTHTHRNTYKQTQMDLKLQGTTTRYKLQGIKFRVLVVALEDVGVWLCVYRCHLWSEKNSFTKKSGTFKYGQVHKYLREAVSNPWSDTGLKTLEHTERRTVYCGAAWFHISSCTSLNTSRATSQRFSREMGGGSCQKGIKKSLFAVCLRSGGVM